MSSQYKIKRCFYIKIKELRVTWHMNVHCPPWPAYWWISSSCFSSSAVSRAIFFRSLSPFLLLCFLLTSLLPFPHLFEHVISYPTLPFLAGTPQTSDGSGGKQISDCCRLHREEYIRGLYVHSDVSLVQSLSRVRLFVTPWTAALQAFLSITNSRSLLKLRSIGLVMPSNCLILSGL